jgi:hypothetical protein
MFGIDEEGDSGDGLHVPMQHPVSHYILPDQR